MDGVVPVAVEGVLHDVEGAYLLRGDLLPERITAPIDLRADDEPGSRRRVPSSPRAAKPRSPALSSPRAVTSTGCPLRQPRAGYWPRGTARAAHGMRSPQTPAPHARELGWAPV